MGIDRDPREMTFRPMPVLTGLSLISLVILYMLGSWQYQRYSDKVDRPPPEADVAAVVMSLEIDIDLSHPGNIQQVYGFADSEPIWRRYAPGRVVATDEPVLVMVEATGGAMPVDALIAKLPPTIAFDGILAVRERNKSSFNAQDNPEQDQWYTLAPEKMWNRLALENVPRVAEPIIMSVRNAADLSQSRLTPNPYAFSEPIDPLPPERHFGYALTWWGMALGLIGVYVALHRARGRLKF